MQTNVQKKIIQIFKIFIDKALIPQLRKLQGSLADWNKFSSMINVDNVNYNQLQLYVDSLPTWSNNQKLGVAPNRKSQIQQIDVPSFNPNKTFGPQRFKPNILTIMENQGNQSKQRDESARNRSNQHHIIISNLQKLVKNLEQNQNIIQNMNKVQLKVESPLLPRVSSSNHNSNNINHYTFNQTTNNGYAYLQHSTNSTQNHNGINISPNISLPTHSHSQPHLQSTHSGSFGYHKVSY